MSDPSEAKKITNINYNCLERIFDFLDLKSLLNVAQTCKRLQIAAAAKFGDEYGEKKVQLKPNSFDETTGDSRIQVYEFTIVVERNNCLPFLRCFGSKISGLRIRYPNCPDPLAEPVYRYVNAYCADSLARIYLKNKTTSSIEIFEKPFRNVVALVIEYRRSKVEFSKLANWFPNVRHLYVHVPNLDRDTTEVYFPHLEHLNLFETDSLLPNENATKLLHSNKQLQSLEFSTSSGMTLSELSNMISGNPSIVKLKVLLLKHYITGNMVTVTMAELMRFVSEHPMLIELCLTNYRLSVGDVNILLGQLKSLKKFVFTVNHRSECDHILNQLGNDWQHTVFSIRNKLHIELNR